MIETLNEFFQRYTAWVVWAEIAAWVAVAVGALTIAGRSQDRRAWRAVAAVSIVIVVERLAMFRYYLSGWLRAALRTWGGSEGYSQRRPVQAAVIIILTMITITLVAVYLVRARGPRRVCRLALVGQAITALGFVAETVSLHQLDVNYISYWAFWLLGLAVAMAGTATAVVFPARTIAVAGVGHATGHARYRVGATRKATRGPGWWGIGRSSPVVVADNPLRATGRVAIVLAVLALPEAVAWLSPTPPTHRWPPRPPGVDPGRSRVTRPPSSTPSSESPAR